MAFPPVAVFIGGAQLEGYTGLTISRSKDELTGTCQVDLFFNYMPSSPVLIEAAVATELLVYIGGQLAFTGTVDTRKGSGIKHGQPGSTVSEGDAEPSRSVNIGPNEYTVQLSARGKTKALVDNSHQVNKTNILKTNTREVLEKLIEPYNVQLEFLGTQVDLDKVRLRDGATVIEEIRRLATENGYYIYETREGKLRVTDDVGPGQGDSLILGRNILSFSASQSEEEAHSEITVKGQRTPKDKWGEEAILKKTTKVIKDSWVQTYSPIVVQHYGDATEEALERRAKFEANKRSSKSKEITIDVFHVMTQGAPWDIGNMHYVEVPPEGIFGAFECTGIVYSVTNSDELKTTLTLSPPPTGQAGGASGLESFAGLDDAALVGTSRQGALGVTFGPGQYPSPWSGPVLQTLTQPAIVEIAATLAGITGLERVAQGDEPTTPPLTLPATFNRQSGRDR